MTHLNENKRFLKVIYLFLPSFLHSYFAQISLSQRGLCWLLFVIQQPVSTLTLTLPNALTPLHFFLPHSNQMIYLFCFLSVASPSY